MPTNFFVQENALEQKISYTNVIKTLVIHLYSCDQKRPNTRQLRKFKGDCDWCGVVCDSSVVRAPFTVVPEYSNWLIKRRAYGRRAGNSNSSRATSRRLKLKAGVNMLNLCNICYIMQKKD